jgi:hypothetical protein
MPQRLQRRELALEQYGKACFFPIQDFGLLSSIALRDFSVALCMGRLLANTELANEANVLLYHYRIFDHRSSGFVRARYPFFGMASLS